MLTGKQSYRDPLLSDGKVKHYFPNLFSPHSSVSTPKHQLSTVTLEEECSSPPHLPVSPSLASFPAHAIHSRGFADAQVHYCVLSLEKTTSLGQWAFCRAGSMNSQWRCERRLTHIRKSGMPFDESTGLVKMVRAQCL